MTKNEILNSGYETELAAEFKHGEYDVIIADLASLDDDGWQIRQSYLSKAGANDYIQVTDGNGTDGWNIAETCGYPTAKRTAAICKHLEISEDGLTEMMDEIDDEEQLSSTDWSMLDALREAAEEESEEEAAKGGSAIGVYRRYPDGEIKRCIEEVREQIPAWFAANPDRKICKVDLFYGRSVDLRRENFSARLDAELAALLSQHD